MSLTCTCVIIVLKPHVNTSAFAAGCFWLAVKCAGISVVTHLWVCSSDYSVCLKRLL